MGVTFDYYIHGYVPLTEVLRIYELAGKIFSSRSYFSPGSHVNGYFHPDKIPDLNSFSGLNIQGISTHGSIKKKNEPLEKLKSILTLGEHDIGEIGLLSVDWQFKEQESTEIKGCNDSFRIEIRQGKRYFGYYSNGSKVNRNKEYGRQFMRKLINAVDLPLDIVEEDGNYLLRHTLRHELSIRRAGFGDRNPSAFLCEMKDSTVEQLFLMLKSSFASVGTDKQNKFSWGASTGALTDHALSRKIYTYVYEFGFYADAYSLDLEFSLEHINDIEHIRSICGPKDKIYTEICSFDLSKDNFANFHVITSQLGHRVYFELRLPEDIKQIEDKLDVKIQQQSNPE